MLANPRSPLMKVLDCLHDNLTVARGCERARTGTIRRVQNMHNTFSPGVYSVRTSLRLIVFGLQNSLSPNLIICETYYRIFLPVHGIVFSRRIATVS